MTYLITQHEGGTEEFLAAITGKGFVFVKERNKAQELPTESLAVSLARMHARQPETSTTIHVKTATGQTLHSFPSVN